MFNAVSPRCHSCASQLEVQREITDHKVLRLSSGKMLTATPASAPCFHESEKQLRRLSVAAQHVDGQDFPCSVMPLRSTRKDLPAVADQARFFVVDGYAPNRVNSSTCSDPSCSSKMGAWERYRTLRGIVNKSGLMICLHRT